jgi:uncharacterized membrane protein YqjE
MIHPLFRLLVAEPQLLAEHLEAYSDLVAQELDELRAVLRRRALMIAVALLGGFVALLLAGVALMLWAITPPEALRAPWVFWAVPVVPGLIGLYGALTARALARHRGFALLREQFAADVAMLREVGSP